MSIVCNLGFVIWSFQRSARRLLSFFQRVANLKVSYEHTRHYGRRRASFPAACRFFAKEFGPLPTPPSDSCRFVRAAIVRAAAKPLDYFHSPLVNNSRKRGTSIAMARERWLSTDFTASPSSPKVRWYSTISNRGS